jgi:autotransporter-associated beta strand protein
LVWNPGSGSMTWNTSNTNWLNSGSPVVYQNTDIANFTNTGAGVVTIVAGGVAPSAVHVNSSSAYTFQGGPIAGSCLVTLSGGGTTTFKSANTYSGPTSVTGGSTLVVDGGDNRLGVAGVGIILDGGTLRTATAGLISTRNITIAAGGGIFDTNGLNSQTTGILTGTGAFIKRGAGTLSLVQSNGHTGLKTIEAGTLQIGNGGMTGSIVGDVLDNANLTFNRATDPNNPQQSTYAGQISGSGSVTKLANAPLLLSGNNSYTGGTTLSGGAIKVGNGTSGTMVGDIVTATGTTLTFAASGGTIHQIGAISGNGTTALSDGATVTADRIRQGTLQLTAATLNIRPNGTSAGVSRAALLDLDSASRLDISNNKIVTSSPLGTLSGGSVYTGITGLIQSGRNGNPTPLWDGNGIVTTQLTATTSNLTSIGVARADDVIPASASTTVLWAGQTVTGSDTLVMYTYGGDANLDGKINIDDYVRIDRSFILGLSGWSNGDFNYDGKINIDDYTTIIDANIGNQNGFVFPTTGGIGQVTAIPEPAGTAAIAAAAASLGLLKRWRRRQTNQKTHDYVP